MALCQRQPANISTESYVHKSRSYQNVQKPMQYTTMALRTTALWNDYGSVYFIEETCKRHVICFSLISSTFHCFCTAIEVRRILCVGVVEAFEIVNVVVITFNEAQYCYILAVCCYGPYWIGRYFSSQSNFQVQYLLNISFSSHFHVCFVGTKIMEIFFILLNFVPTLLLLYLRNMYNYSVISFKVNA